MITRSHIAGWLRQTFGKAPERAFKPSEAGQSTEAHPPQLLLCPAVGPPFQIVADVPDNEWPDDPDHVPSWLIRREQRCLAIGLQPFAYRTRREHERAIELCAAAFETPVIKKEAAVMDALPAPEAARKFLGWLRTTSRTGEWTDVQLRDLYAEHCAEAGLTPCPEMTMRKHLKALSGVEKALQEAGKSPSGHRKRPTVWTIAPSLATVSKMRLAA